MCRAQSDCNRSKGYFSYTKNTSGGGAQWPRAARCRMRCQATNANRQARRHIDRVPETFHTMLPFPSVRLKMCDTGVCYYCEMCICSMSRIRTPSEQPALEDEHTDSFTMKPPSYSSKSLQCITRRDSRCPSNFCPILFNYSTSPV